MHVRDLDELFDELKANGARISYEPFEKPYGVKEGVVIDPDGHHLAFAQELDS